jgi:hypothetical protein
MASECRNCKRTFESEHDVELFFDQDTNEGFRVCHDCLIVSSRHRRWVMKAQMQRKMQALELKRKESGR